MLAYGGVWISVCIHAHAQQQGYQIRLLQLQNSETTCMPYICTVHACLTFIPYMYVLYVCLICMPYMHALYACLTRMPYMCASYVWLQELEYQLQHTARALKAKGIQADPQRYAAASHAHTVHTPCTPSTATMLADV